MHKNIQVTRIAPFVLILLAGFGAALTSIFIKNLSGSGYPYSTFLFRPEARFLDFYFPYSIATDPYNQLVEHTGSTSISWQMPEIVNGADWEKNRLGPVYFPFAYWIAYPFQLLPLGAGLLVFWTVAILIFFSIGIRQIRAIAGSGTALVVCLLSYPFLFLLDRSNFEIFIFLFVYLFFTWYDNRPWLGAGVLACAIAMKFLPVAYIVIYLRDKKYKQALTVGGLAFLLNVSAYTLYPGGLINNIRAHLFNLRISSLFYGLDGRDVAFSSSIASGVKYLFIWLWPQPDLEAASLQAAGVIHWLIPVIAIIVLGYSFFLENERWKQAALLTSLILLLPASSADYRLLLMYIPFFLWLRKPNRSRFDTLYELFFAGLFIPKSYFHLPVLPEISISVLINPLLMLAMIALIILERVRGVSDNKKTFKNNWDGFPGWQKYGAVIISSLYLIFFSISSQSHLLAKEPSVITLQQLKILGEESYKDKEFLSSIGYYGQWMALEPANPDPRVGMAQAYIRERRYWESFQEYKKAVWLSTPGTISRTTAEIGLQSSLQYTVCDMMKKRELEWGRLLQTEYKENFSNLSFPNQIDCAKIIE